MQCTIFNRPCVAGLFYNHLCYWLIKCLSQHFPQNLQNIITPKPWELESWNFERMFTPPPGVTCQVSGVMCHMSGVTCQVSGVMCKIFFLQSGWASRWRVCYQRGLPRIVFFGMASRRWFNFVVIMRWLLVDRDLYKAFRQSVSVFTLRPQNIREV